MSERQPAVQGLFYPNSKVQLEKQFRKIFPELEFEGKAKACISPHAGLIYSGETAGKSINNLKKSANYIILCPNHTGHGSKISIYPPGEWKTILGTSSAINTEISQKLAEMIPEASLEENAHLQEHSAEIELLLLQKKFKHDFKIVVLCLAEQDLQVLKKLGQALDELYKQFDFSVIASSDFTHYEPEESAEKKDKKAIKLILHNHVEGFYDYIIETDASICGFAGITVLLEFCKARKLKAKLLDYCTSANVTKDKSNVVGYASIIWE